MFTDLTPIDVPVSLLLVGVAVSWWYEHIAERHAQLLLHDVLTDAESRQLATDGYLKIRSPSAAQRSYHIPRQQGSRVQMYEQGRLVCELCLQVERSLPPSDLLVLHKLLIEGNEAVYLATANHFATTGEASSAPSAISYWYC